MEYWTIIGKIIIIISIINSYVRASKKIVDEIKMETRKELTIHAIDLAASFPAAAARGARKHGAFLVDKLDRQTQT